MASQSCWKGSWSSSLLIVFSVDLDETWPKDWRSEFELAPFWTVLQLNSRVNLVLERSQSDCTSRNIKRPTQIRTPDHRFLARTGDAASKRPNPEQPHHPCTPRQFKAFHSNLRQFVFICTLIAVQNTFPNAKREIDHSRDGKSMWSMTRLKV